MEARQSESLRLLEANPAGRGQGQGPRVSFGPQVEVPPPGLGSRQGLDALDPNVVRSALAAGISEKHLQKMAGLLRRHPQRMEDVPRTRPRDNPGDALDESAEEDDCLGGCGGSGILLSHTQQRINPMEKAIVQLTRVRTALAKPSAKKSNTIEQLLDGSGLEKVGDGFGSTGARKNATALRALRRCLVDQPEYI